MTIASDHVREIFKGLETGDSATFFTLVADDVDWGVMGTHPLAGHYSGKADLIAGTFAKLGHVLTLGAQLHLEHLIIDGDQAAVEL
jgi:ketosteroid isomerase-like protein